METITYNLLIVIGTFLGMEVVAWFTHKYVMHGFLWALHKDHHNKEGSDFFEHNDFFFLIFALPGILGLLIGTINNYNLFFWIGLGITCYGFTYFFVHDIFIHQRFSFLRKSENPYLRAVLKAHRVHHKYLQKQKGECFGLLWIPLKYFPNKTPLK